LVCPYFQRARSDLNWATNEQQLLDTMPGTEGAVPHFTQVDWRLTDTTTQRGSPIIEVDGVSHYIGHGDPGRASKGETNNCLIDSLRQCIGMSADRKAVRADLLHEFGNAVGRAQVSQTSFLDVESHWQSIIQSLFKHDTSDLSAHCNTRDYCVIALDSTNPGNGNVSGNLTAPYRLIVMNTSDRHFDPCLQLQREESAGSDRPR
jgi:hypothetical protein